MKGAFIWPDYGFPPTALLGNNLEALDPIRTEHRCYITWESTKSLFVIYSDSQSAIENAITRIRTTICEIATRSRATTKVYMIEPLKPHIVGREVELIPYQQFLGNASRDDGAAITTVVPRMTGPPPTSKEREDWLILQSLIGYSNDTSFKRVVAARLESARYYRGHVRMRVNFGVMRLSTYKKPGLSNHNLEEFFAMLRDPQAVAEIVGE